MVDALDPRTLRAVADYLGEKSRSEKHERDRLTMLGIAGELRLLAMDNEHVIKRRQAEYLELGNQWRARKAGGR
jgi:hypothetical protein